MKSILFEEKREFSRFEAWIDMLMLANHCDSKFIFKGRTIEVKRGQMARSEVELSDRWRWSRGKVRTFLTMLQTEQQIEQQKDNLTSIITIINYDKYQKNEQQNEQQTEQQKDSRPNSRKTHTINVNELEPMKTNEKENYLAEKSADTETESIFSFDQFWDSYGKKIDRTKCEKAYRKIKEEERGKIKDVIMRYVDSTPDVQYRKNPLSWLNGICWYDEIQVPNKKQIQKTSQDNVKYYQEELGF